MKQKNLLLSEKKVRDDRTGRLMLPILLRVKGLSLISEIVSQRQIVNQRGVSYINNI